MTRFVFLVLICMLITMLNKMGSY